MSWLKTAVNRAVVVGGTSSVTRTVRGYADAVASSVATGAKIVRGSVWSPLRLRKIVQSTTNLFRNLIAMQEIMDELVKTRHCANSEGVENYKSFKVTLKSLEELAVSCRGSERMQLLKRWSAALAGAKKGDQVSSSNKNLEQNIVPSAGDDSMVLYFDADLGGEPMNFLDVFLRSQALEGLTLSMILEPPNDEEVRLLLDIFGLCLTGGKEIHDAVMSSIQDLAASFSNFQDELLVKREEMLQFAQEAIAGLKLSADVARIDAEASTLRKKIENLVEPPVNGEVDNKNESSIPVEDLKEALEKIRLCSRLESLLLEKKLVYSGDSHAHFQKVDKLKVLSESLANCSTKAEKRISDHRHQKEEAINFRVAKAKEVIETEKELSAEIFGLEKQQEELEAKLKKVKTSLAVVVTRLKKTREERDQFDEASNEILMHLKSKEEDLSKSIASCKIEGDVVRTWINFLEDTWVFQSSRAEENEKQTSVELQKYGNHLVKMTTDHVLACKEELGSAVSQLGESASNLKIFSDRSGTEDTNTILQVETNSKTSLEEEYVEIETKIKTVLSVIDDTKELFDATWKTISREDIDELYKLFDEIEVTRMEFKSIDRPILDIENPAKTVAPKKEKLQKSSSLPPWRKGSPSLKNVKPRGSTKLIAYEQFESDLQKDSTASSPGDIQGWEFDAV